MSQTILERIKAEKIIAIVRGVPSQKIVDLASALERGGITCIEITFDQSSEEKALDTLAAIRALRESMGPRICVGAGTVMTVKQVRQAAEAGAEYMISPNADERVICETKRQEKVSIPGAMTATEIVTAYGWGADFVKVFPAGQFGPAYIKAIKAPLKHIPVIAVGNVTSENCAEWIRAGAAGVGVGGNLVNAQWIAEGRFGKITTVAKTYTEALRTVK